MSSSPLSIAFPFSEFPPALPSRKEAKLIMQEELLENRKAEGFQGRYSSNCIETLAATFCRAKHLAEMKNRFFILST